mgnify:FL=1
MVKVTNYSGRRFRTRNMTLMPEETKSIDVETGIQLMGLSGVKVIFEAGDNLSNITEYRLIKAAKFVGLTATSKDDAIKQLVPKRTRTKQLKSVVTKAKEAVLPAEEETTEE